MKHVFHIQSNFMSCVITKSRDTRESDKSSHIVLQMHHFSAPQDVHTSALWFEYGLFDKMSELCVVEDC